MRRVSSSFGPPRRSFHKEFRWQGQHFEKEDTLRRALTATSFGQEGIAILVDADDDAAATVQSLTNLLQLTTGRTLIEGEWSKGEPGLGFFVAPDGANRGELETLVWNAWSRNSEHAAGKEAVLMHLNKMEIAGWPAKSPDKARIGAFLSAAYDEDPRLGPGAREGLFDFEAPGFARLRKFLLEFTEPTTG